MVKQVAALTDNIIKEQNSVKSDLEALCRLYYRELEILNDSDHDISVSDEFLLFKKAILLTCVYVAGYNSALDDRSVKTINAICGETFSLYAYTNMLTRIKKGTTPIDRIIEPIEGAIINTAVLRWVSQKERYRPDDDIIIKCIKKIWLFVAGNCGLFNSQRFCNAETIARMIDSHSSHIVNTMKYEPSQIDSKHEGLYLGEKCASFSSEPIETVYNELRNLVGLDTVKIEVESLTNLAKVFQLRKQRKLAVPDFSFHLVFSGNPGTGKTTVARIIAKIYGHLGLLSKGHVIEVDRAGLVANYVGQTATKVHELIARANGGILFIDEAYSLSSGGEKDYGREAIEILLKAMEDQRDDLVVIAAGYDEKMEEFLNSNPGLRSRFPKVISFPDYSPEELAEIFVRTAEKSQYNLTHAAKVTLYEETKRMWKNRGEDFANARDVRNLFERTISAHANRVSSLPNVTEAILTTVEEVDVATAISASEPEIKIEL